MTNTNINELTEGMKHNLSNIETNFSETIKKFESLPVLFKEIEKDQPKIVKNHLISGFKDEMNKLYFELKKIQGSISLLSESFNDSIPNHHRFDIFNKTTGYEELGLYSETKNSLEKLYELTDEKIEILREYDEFGELIWSNPNPDRTRDISEEDKKDINEFITKNHSYIENKGIKTEELTKDNIKNFKDNIKNFIDNIPSSELNKIAESVGINVDDCKKYLNDIDNEFKKQYPSVLDKSCSVKDKLDMVDKFKKMKLKEHKKISTKKPKKEIKK